MSIFQKPKMPKTSGRSSSHRTRGVAAARTLEKVDSAPAPCVGGFERMSAAAYLKIVGTNTGAPASTTPSGANRVGGVSGNASTPKKRRASPEEDLHRAVFQWIFLHEARYPQLIDFMHVPNGGARSKGEAGKLKAMGVRKGVSDIICHFPGTVGNGFACELKAPGGKATPEQLIYLEKARAHGWVTGVCDSFEGFLTLAYLYLGVKR
jgi:hypothetical protein